MIDTAYAPRTTRWIAAALADPLIYEAVVAWEDGRFDWKRGDTPAELAENIRKARQVRVASMVAEWMIRCQTFLDGVRFAQSNRGRTLEELYRVMRGEASPVPRPRNAAAQSAAAWGHTVYR
jgi:hypothetical protein